MAGVRGARGAINAPSGATRAEGGFARGGIGAGTSLATMAVRSPKQAGQARTVTKEYRIDARVFRLQQRLRHVYALEAFGAIPAGRTGSSCVN